MQSKPGNNNWDKQFVKEMDMHTLFGVKNDFTPEEEAQVRKENEWAFHD